MTLEQEILQAIKAVGPNGSPADYTDAAAKIARERIKEALYTAVKFGWDLEEGKIPHVPGNSHYHVDVDQFVNQYLKENGLL